MGQAKMLAVIVIFALLIVGSFSMFTVDEREKAILFRLGEIVKTDFKPGLYFKLPFVNNVRKFDARVQTLDAEPERYLTSEKKNVIVDAFVKWRIGDVERYFTSTGGDPNTANSRLSQVIKDGLRGEFGKRTIQEVVSGERKEVMNILTAQASEQAKLFGIDLLDVRIKRIDLAKEISDSVYRRMEAERLRVAKDLRARGAETAEVIKAEADRKKTVLLAEAYRKAETIRGEGDGASAKIYADAYNQDKEFYALYRSLGAYRKSFASKDDILVLQPDTEFFKYFK